MNAAGNRIKRHVIEAVGFAGGYRIAKFLTRHVPRVLVYHRFGTHGCPAAVFEAQVRLLSRQFRVISLSTLCRLLLAGEEVPRNAVVITIDDGYADFYRVAFPIIRKYGVPATVYVVSDFVDRKIWLWPDILAYALKATSLREIAVALDGETRVFPLDSITARQRAWNDIADHCLSLRNRVKLEFLAEVTHLLGVTIPPEPVDQYAALTWDELREMQAAGIEVGSHTCTHPKLTMLDHEELEHELKASRERIESMLQQEVEGFCYPNGGRADVNEDVKQAVRRCGYRHATVGYHDMDTTADLYELGRYGAAVDVRDFRKTIFGIDYLRGR